MGNTQISLPLEFSSEAQRYSRILGVKDADKTDFMQLIEIMRGRFHKAVDGGHITDDELYEKIIEQEECIETNYLENQKKTFHIFKIGNRQFPAPKTFIKEIIIPILKGSEPFYQGTDKPKFCKSIS